MNFDLYIVRSRAMRQYFFAPHKHKYTKYPAWGITVPRHTATMRSLTVEKTRQAKLKMALPRLMFWPILLINQREMHFKFYFFF